MGNKINININNLFTVNVDAGTEIYEISKDYYKVTGKKSVGARINNIITDYDTKLYNDMRIDFFDVSDSDGNKMYQMGLKFIMILAVYRLWNKNIEFKYSLDKGIYAEVDKKLTEADIDDLTREMNQIVAYDYPIHKCVVKKRDAYKYYMSINETEKAENILNIPNSFVELFELDHVYNYFYGEMPPSTGVLENFRLEKLGKNGIVLMYPRLDYNCEIPKFSFNQKIYDELVKNMEWAKKLKVDYVASLNKIIARGDIRMFIKMNNIVVNDNLLYTANEISKNKKIKLILIGGPSSSGKTTSAKKLCTYLKTFGLNPIVISMDDYFVERNVNPKDENGNYDFECLEALDLKLFNKQMRELTNGKSVVLPTYNFVTGEKEYTRDPIKMDDDDILVIEGLHCLNDAVSRSVPRENKYKILVCPFTPLGVDRHNHLSTIDMRLIRRIVRDNRTRGKSVEDTLRSWDSVKRGENKYIFPYEGDVDAVLNTAFAYEIGVLRVYVEPLLYSVPMTSEFYEESRRILGSLRAFFPISSEYIEDDNILREFIGGSIYEK